MIVTTKLNNSIRITNDRMEIITFCKFRFMLKPVLAWATAWHVRPTFDKNQALGFVFSEIEKSTLSNSVGSSGLSIVRANITILRLLLYKCVFPVKSPVSSAARTAC
jgi:hypothetical protein